MMDDFHTGGFDDASLQSAAVFRAILDAVSRPGTMQKIPCDLKPPAPLSAASAAVLLTLSDQETSLWLAPSILNHGVKNYLKFHTGAPLVETPASVAFGFFPSTEIPDLSGFSTGTDEYPDTSTTIIIQIDGDEPPVDVVFNGPGIETKTDVSIPGLSLDFWRFVKRNHDLFPRGLDFLFCLPDAIAACPRSTSVTIKGDG